jgi:hypothetical protein
VFLGGEKHATEFNFIFNALGDEALSEADEAFALSFSAQRS